MAARPYLPAIHVSLFSFQLPTTVNQALIEALHDYMLYSASPQQTEPRHKYRHKTYVGRSGRKH